MTDICKNIITLQTAMIKNKIDSLSLELAGALQANGMNIRTISPTQIGQWDAFAEAMSERLTEDEGTPFTLYDFVRTVVNNPSLNIPDKHSALKKDWDDLYRDVTNATKKRLDIKDEDDDMIPAHVVYCQNAGCQYNESGVCHSEGFVQIECCC